MAIAAPPLSYQNLAVFSDYGGHYDETALAEYHSIIGSYLKMHSKKLLEHFRNPHNIGELPAPAVTAEVCNPACGDIMRLSLQFQADRVQEARYKVRGCTASIAAGSALTELVRGLTRAELTALSTAAIEEALGGLPPESKHAAALCIDAVRAVLKS
jgi:nitrogen fixation NifU-like protein